jgi:hypothetical protein
VVEQRIAEEAGRLTGSGAVTGWAALRMHGAGYFDGWAADGRTPLPVPLVVPSGSNLRRSPTIEVRRERLGPGETTAVRGVPVTSPERAAFDAARRALDLRAAVVVLDMALASGVIRQAGFTVYARSKRGWAGCTLVQQALPLVDDRSMSPAETLLRLIWQLDGGFPRPRCNWPVADESGRFIARPDLLSEQLAVVGEFDGRLHRSRGRHRDDLRRDDAFRAVGLEPFRVVGADLASPGLILARIQAAIDRSARLGVRRSWRLQANPRPVA